MKIHLIENRDAFGWATFGGYWPRGQTTGTDFSLRNAAGQTVPIQSDVTARWPDGSVKWSRHTAPAVLLGEGGELTAGSSGAGELETGGLFVAETPTVWEIRGGRIRLLIPKEGNALATDCTLDGTAMFQRVTPVLSLTHETEEGSGDELITRTETVPCPAQVTGRKIEEAGPLQVTVRFDGIHPEHGVEKMPFRIRMTVHDDGEIEFDDTFFYQGDPAQDRLGSWGLRFETGLTGAPWQRHIRLMAGRGIDHDAPTQLFHWREHLNPALLAGQMQGEIIPETEQLWRAAAELPRWDRFLLLQDSASRCVIRKKAWAGGCWVDGTQGTRSPGGMAVHDPEKAIAIHIRDFWEKYPSGLEAEGLGTEKARLTAWFYAPQAAPYDFRHYAERSYPRGTYEGFDYSRPDPNGIAVTRRAVIYLDRTAPTDETLQAQNRAVRKPPVYLAAPEYYHEHRAFGVWSLPQKDTETSAWIESQIAAAAEFYRHEAEQRSWYGLFNYGDFMHTYEAARHQWRYDVGGYAWDNTELAPTYWLWLQFLRTGSEEVFSLAEALSRHAADVDQYHFGPMQGLGSRHNVRHWGCPCKEPRVSMAGHHRPLYYLTGDRRIGDCLEDTLRAPESLGAMPWFTRSGKGITLRSGPDWAALVSNWMTAWERTLDPKWKTMIETGIDDLARTPLQLTSGPEFGFDPESGHLIYQGESAEPQSMHLQACMGETEIWIETAEALPSPALAEMTARNGQYFYWTPEERMRESGGLLEGRTFQSPIYSAEMQAWAARRAGDAVMGREIWRRLLSLLWSPEKPEGFQPVVWGETDEGKPMTEIPWISTNFTAQWCLKAIVCLELIPGELPGTFDELREALKAKPAEYRLYGA